MTKTDDQGAATRAERLAAALRENLKRRKVQARGRVPMPGDEGAAPEREGEGHLAGRPKPGMGNEPS